MDSAACKRVIAHTAQQMRSVILGQLGMLSGYVEEMRSPTTRPFETSSNWKRVKKFKNATGLEARTFRNKTTDGTVLEATITTGRNGVSVVFNPVTTKRKKVVKKKVNRHRFDLDL